jgi:hypothetical protein
VKTGRRRSELRAQIRIGRAGPPEKSAVTAPKLLILVAILACAIALVVGCAAEQEPAVEQAQVVDAPHEQVAEPSAVETATVPQPQVRASPVRKVSPGAQTPPPPIASSESTEQQDSDGALSTIGEVLTAPFRLIANVVGFIL